MPGLPIFPMLNSLPTVALALSLHSLLSVPADVYVDASASCAIADGSEIHPFCTVSEALGVAVDGDVLRIAPGTYQENLTIAEDLTLLGTDGAAATILDGGLMGTVVTVETDAVVTIDGLTLTRGFGRVGGLDNFGSVVLRNSTLSGNFGEGSAAGPAISHWSSGTLELERCELLDNVALPGPPMSTSQSTAIFAGLDSGDVRLTECSILGGSGSTSTVIHLSSTNLTLDSSLIANNAGFDALDTVWAVGAAIEMTNSTISGNAGEVMFVYSTYAEDSVSLRNCTIVGNGGPIRWFNYYNTTDPATFELRNSILAGNGFSTQVSPYAVATQYSLISTGGSGQAAGEIGNIVGTPADPVDPLLAPLAMNGGPTLTHALLPGSPAIGAGASIGFEPFDQTGKPRTPGYTDMGSVRASLDVAVSACTTVPNSTGSEGALSIGGSGAFNGMFTMTMTPLPANVFGFFLVSPGTGLIANPGGSFGNLCLTGDVGRYVGAGQIQSSGESGIISLTADPRFLPRPTGFSAAQTGETWYFQGWFRDVAAGTDGSNFAQAVGLTFR